MPFLIHPALSVPIDYSSLALPILLTSYDSTPLLQNWLGNDAAKRHRREIHFPTGRFGEAIEQAHAVLFLASDESSFVNGTDFVVDGGMSRVRSWFSLMYFHSPSFMCGFE